MTTKHRKHKTAKKRHKTPPRAKNGRFKKK